MVEECQGQRSKVEREFSIATYRRVCDTPEVHEHVAICMHDDKGKGGEDRRLERAGRYVLAFNFLQLLPNSDSPSSLGVAPSLNFTAPSYQSRSIQSFAGAVACCLSPESRPAALSTRLAATIFVGSGIRKPSSNPILSLALLHFLPVYSVRRFNCY